MSKLIELVKSKVGCGYAWGAQGEILTEAKYKWFIKTFGISHYEFPHVSASKWMGKQCFDCSGLIVWALQELGLIPKSADYTASMIYSQLCTPIKKEELTPNDLVFIKTNRKITHVGLYIGNNQVVEAKGTSYGVVTSTLTGFNVFGRLKFKIPEAAPVAPPAPVKEEPKDDEVSTLVKEMIADGIVADEQYWYNVLTGKITPKVEYLKIAFSRATAKI